MKVSIILLAQHESMLKQSLASIGLYTEMPYEVIVINDGGSEEIVRWLQMNKSVRAITTTERMGVAAGYNLGASVATGDQFVFMRDHMMVSEEWLPCLLACMERHENAAIVGPLSNDVSGKQRLPFPCDSMQRLDKLARAFVLAKSGHSKSVTRLLSQLMLVRKAVFEQLGGFDERFGLETFEDDDLCYRALEAGYGLYIAEDCFVRYVAPPSLFPEDPHWYGRLLQINKDKAASKWGFDTTEALFNWKKRVTVSLCMIVKNEEETLGRCLSSVQGLVDEIVILDTGSEDRTKEIAAKYTDCIYDFTWVNDFAKARNHAFSLATKDYILWLDADDILQPEDANKFRAITSALEWNTDAVSMNYHLSFDEYGNVTSSLRRNRLVKRENRFQWVGVVHEYLEVSGKIVYADMAVTHDRKHTNSSRNLHIYEGKHAAGEAFSARDMYYFANELSDHRLWERAIAMYEQFLQQSEGWVEDKINACGRAADALQELGRMVEAKSKALQAFAYALPRAEGCCRLGSFYMKEANYAGAIFWYNLATDLQKPVNHGALLQHACWTWLPHIQLCICYDRLGQHQLAYDHNEIARGFVPNNSSVLANKQYLENVLKVPSVTEQ